MSLQQLSRQGTLSAAVDWLNKARVRISLTASAELTKNEQQVIDPNPPVDIDVPNEYDWRNVVTGPAELREQNQYI